MKRTQRSGVCFAIAGAVLFSGPGRAEPATPLERFFQAAENESPLARAGVVRLGAAERELESLPRWYLPNVYVEAGFGGAANSTTSDSGPLARAISEWTLWDGGRTQAQRTVILRRQQLARLEQLQRQWDARKTLSFVYYRAVRLAELNELAAEEIRDYEILERAIGARMRIGSAEMSDILTARLRVGARRNEEKNNQAVLQTLRASLTTLSGLPADSIPEFPVNAGLAETLVQPGLLNRRAPGNSPESHPRYRLELARLLYAASQLEYIKTDLNAAAVSLQVYGGYGPRLDALDSARPEAGAEVRVRVPLYASGDRSARVEGLQAQLEAARLESEQSLRELRAELDEHHSLREQDLRSLGPQEALIAQARRSLQLAQAEFRRGQKSPADIVATLDAVYGLRRERVHTLFRLRLSFFEEYLLQQYQNQNQNEETENETD